MIWLLTDSVENAVGMKVVKNEENIVNLYLYYQQDCW